jgi:hypothetical protein
MTAKTSLVSTTERSKLTQVYRSEVTTPSKGLFPVEKAVFFLAFAKMREKIWSKNLMA